MKDTHGIGLQVRVLGGSEMGCEVIYTGEEIAPGGIESSFAWGFLMSY
jgi:hypothetical protein